MNKQYRKSQIVSLRLPSFELKIFLFFMLFLFVYSTYWLTTTKLIIKFLYKLKEREYGSANKSIFFFEFPIDRQTSVKTNSEIN